MRSSCENSCTLRWHVYERDRQNYSRQCRKPILGKYIAKPTNHLETYNLPNISQIWNISSAGCFMLSMYPNWSMYPNLDTIFSRWTDELFTFTLGCKMVAFHICQMANFVTPSLKRVLKNLKMNNLVVPRKNVIWNFFPSNRTN